MLARRVGLHFFLIWTCRITLAVILTAITDNASMVTRYGGLGRYFFTSLLKDPGSEWDGNLSSSKMKTRLIPQKTVAFPRLIRSSR